MDDEISFATSPIQAGTGIKTILWNIIRYSMFFYPDYDSVSFSQDILPFYEPFGIMVSSSGILFFPDWRVFLDNHGNTD